jgi:hypothetical protein
VDSLLNGSVLSAVVNVLLPIVLPFVFASLALAVKHASDWVRAKAGKEQWALVETLSASAVAAAEQYFRIEGGATKKAYAMDVIRTGLKKSGVVIPDATISASIEAAVKAASGTSSR